MVAGYIPCRLERGCNMTRAIYTAAKDGKVIAQRDALIWAVSYTHLTNGIRAAESAAISTFATEQR